MARRKRKSKKRGIIRSLFHIMWLAVTYMGKAELFILSGLYKLAAIIASKAVRKAKQRKNISGNDKEAEYSAIKPEKEKRGSFEDFGKRLMTGSLIISIVGKRGSGKSSLGFRIVENIHAKTGRPGFVIGVGQEIIPSWINEVKNIDEVRNNGVLLVDEGAVAFSSRESLTEKNRDLGKLMAVARHKDISLILVTQNTGMIDKTVLSLTDVLLLKEGSLLQEKMERPAMKQFYTTAKEEFSRIESKERIKHAYVFSDDFEGMIRAGMPSFWTKEVSKSRGI